MINEGDFCRTIANIEIEVQFFSPEIVRIRKRPAGIAVRDGSFSVVMQPGCVEVTHTDEKMAWCLKSRSLLVKLEKETGRVCFLTSHGEMLLRESECGSSFTPENYAGEATFRVRQSFRLDPDEAIYGLGQHQSGRMNHRGGRVVLSQVNMEIAIPFFLSIKGYGLLWDNASPTVFTDNSRETAFDSELGECADYYFLYGGSGDGVVAKMRELTGQAPLPPLWSFGFAQSKERYSSQYEVVAVVERYRELGVPLDMIIQDWQYWRLGRLHWNEMEFANPAYCDPATMMKQVHDLHAKLLISVWPNFGRDTEPFRQMEARNYLLPFGTYMAAADTETLNYDAFNPEARLLFWKLLSRHLYAAGVDGWWLDASEPEQPYPDVINMWPTPDVFDTPTAAGSFRRVRNAYPIVHVGGVAEQQRVANPEKRVFILTRSAFAGQQRYGASVWSGDIDSSWEALRRQIPAGLNFALCGNPFWNSDIGGFFADRDFKGGVGEPGFRELFVRWMQFGLFTSMMRAHGTFSPREIWQFGQRGSWAFDAIEAAIQLRYRLLPYIYATAWEVTDKGGSFMRPLWLEDPADRRLHDLGDEFLFGSSLLVAPVVESMYVHEGKTDFSRTGKRRVVLPAGSWFDFETEERMKGGGEFARPTPIDSIPLYVKAGTILPLAPVMQFSGERPWDDLEFRIYPGADGTFTLYEDAGEGYGYEKGAYATIAFLWNESKQQLTIQAVQGYFPGMLKERIFRLRLIGGGEQCVNYEGHTMTIDF